MIGQQHNRPAKKRCRCIRCSYDHVSHYPSKLFLVVLGALSLDVVIDETFNRWLVLSQSKFGFSHNPVHVLHRLLPPVVYTSHNYCLRPRAHDRSLPERLSHDLTDCNFIIRMLFYFDEIWHDDAFQTS